MNANDENRIFTEEDGLQFAIAIVDPLNDQTYLDHLGRDMEEFLSISVSQTKVTPETGYEEKIFDLHKCSDEELGLDDSGNSKFYPIYEEHA